MDRRRKYPPGAAPRPADHSAAMRARRAAAGWQRVDVALPPSAAAALATLRQRLDAPSDAETIARVLVAAVEG